MQCQPRSQGFFPGLGGQGKVEWLNGMTQVQFREKGKYLAGF